MSKWIDKVPEQEEKRPKVKLKGEGSGIFWILLCGLIIVSIPIGFAVANAFTVRYPWGYMMTFGLLSFLIGGTALTDRNYHLLPSRYANILALMGALICISGFSFKHIGAEPKTQNPYIKTDTNDFAEAFVVAKNTVKNQLKSPSTAKFPWYDTSFVKRNTDGSFSVYAYVDAQNSFGATLRRIWHCRVVLNFKNNQADCFIN